MRADCLVLFVVLGLAAAVLPAPGAILSQPVTGAANVATLVKLALAPFALVFPDADPDTTPLIAPSSGPIAITAKARTTPGGVVTLTLLATDDLRSGMSTIAIETLRWTATGAGFVPGTASATAAQPVATWINSGTRSGTQSFVFANSWAHAAGTYTATLVYTLAAE